MKNLKIRMKLIGSFMVTILLTAVIGLVGIISLNTASDNTALLNDRTNMAIMSARMGRNVQQQRAAYRGASTYHLMEMHDNVDSSLAELETLDADYDALDAELGNLLATEQGKQHLSDIRAAYASYTTERNRFIDAMQDEGTTDAEMMEVLVGLTTPVNSLVDAVAGLTDYINDVTDQQADQAAATAQSSTITMIIVLVVAIAVAIILSLYISSMISKPLAMMQAVLLQVGETGSMKFPDEQVLALKKEGAFKDEIGQSINSFVNMMDRLLYISARLNEVADGDLTSEIDTLTAEDTMGTALVNMSDSLNHMFSEINSVASQVSTASHEIAQGAQSLAQGSTEQASTVEEISASINEITEQANVSVDTASSAANDSQTIRDIAQEGNEKMAHLSAAVQEMSEASQSIGNVIKVIDDIAFQTNILALNAAVEAARAGEHGKGFAVVADEVRNLAGKSAEAAKETAGLISANIEKSEMGLTMSQETAETLNKIVEGVENTTNSLNTIAQQSEGAKAATEQVNLAVDQVAQVVQQNSATSEESAAASEEMSSQAQVLQQLIARFKLKNQDGNFQNVRQQLPQAGQNTVPSTYNNDVIF